MINMNNEMKTFEMKQFVKYVVLKVGLFESEIIDEQNFDINDTYGIMNFKRQYIYKDDCMIVKIDM